jgi:hypothetical protein
LGEAGPAWPATKWGRAGDNAVSSPPAPHFACIAPERFRRVVLEWLIVIATLGVARAPAGGMATS